MAHAKQHPHQSAQARATFGDATLTRCCDFSSSSAYLEATAPTLTVVSPIARIARRNNAKGNLPRFPLLIMIWTYSAPPSLLAIKAAASVWYPRRSISDFRVRRTSASPLMRTLRPSIVLPESSRPRPPRPDKPDPGTKTDRCLVRSLPLLTQPEPSRPQQIDVLETSRCAGIPRTVRHADRRNVDLSQAHGSTAPDEEREREASAVDLVDQGLHGLSRAVVAGIQPISEFAKAELSADHLAAQDVACLAGERLKFLASAPGDLCFMHGRFSAHGSPLSCRNTRDVYKSYSSHHGSADAHLSAADIAARHLRFHTKRQVRMAEVFTRKQRSFARKAARLTGESSLEARRVSLHCLTRPYADGTQAFDPTRRCSENAHANVRPNRAAPIGALKDRVLAMAGASDD
jgi:hypothetical protein